MSDLDDLARDFDQVRRVSPKTARTILQETAEDAKQHWQIMVPDVRYGRGYARAITYNTYQLADGAEGEVGARTGGLGSMGLLDDPENAGGVRSAPSRARRSTAKFIEKEFDKRGKIVVDKTLRDAGL